MSNKYEYFKMTMENVDQEDESGEIYENGIFEDFEEVLSFLVDHRYHSVRVEPRKALINVPKCENNNIITVWNRMGNETIEVCGLGYYEVLAIKALIK